MSVATLLGDTAARHPLRDAFLKWQCHVRQMMMRDDGGRPSAAITPDVYLPGQDSAIGSVITILNKAPAYSQTPEMLHMARKTMDPAQRREQALRFLSASYFQKYREFSDILTATFAPSSAGAARLRKAGRARLVFDAFSQRFDLDCKVWRLAGHNPLAEATLAHNRLFNPDLPGDTEILGFEPDWQTSVADPAIGASR